MTTAVFDIDDGLLSNIETLLGIFSTTKEVSSTLKDDLVEDDQYINIAAIEDVSNRTIISLKECGESRDCPRLDESMLPLSCCMLEPTEDDCRSFALMFANQLRIYQMYISSQLELEMFCPTCVFIDSSSEDEFTAVSSFIAINVPQKTYILLGSKRGIIRIFDCKQYEHHSHADEIVLSGHGRSITSLQYIRKSNGRLIASCSLDYSARIWDVKKRLCLVSINHRYSDVCTTANIFHLVTQRLVSMLKKQEFADSQIIVQVTVFILTFMFSNGVSESITIWPISKVEKNRILVATSTVDCRTANCTTYLWHYHTNSNSLEILCCPAIGNRMCVLKTLITGLIKKTSAPFQMTVRASQRLLLFGITNHLRQHIATVTNADFNANTQCMHLGFLHPQKHWTNGVALLKLHLPKFVLAANFKCELVMLEKKTV